MQSEKPIKPLINRDSETLIANCRQALYRGEPWFLALLDTVAKWNVPYEVVDEREYRYLVGGEAFDWLLLAERICNALEKDDLLPIPEVDALLLDERMPMHFTEEEFKNALGPAKYRAHLNFTYGVLVEEALQLAMEQRSQKERGTLMMAHDVRIEGDVYRRIYGNDKQDLLREFRTAQNKPMINRLSLTEHKEFTYWLFKRRVAQQEPARVASDTRQGMLMLHRLREIKNRRNGRLDIAQEPNSSETENLEQFITTTKITPH